MPQESSFVVPWTSLVLVVGSALATAAFMASHRDDDKDKPKHPRGRQRRKAYSVRRQQSRLSPVTHNRSRRSLFYQHTSMPDEEENHVFDQVNLDYPKSHNWNHFEPTNEDDVKDGLVTPPSVSSYQDSDDDSSQSDEFVWTTQASTRRLEFQHHDRRASDKKQQVVVEKGDESATAWTNIRKRIKERNPFASDAATQQQDAAQSSSESYVMDDEGLSDTSGDETQEPIHGTMHQHMASPLQRQIHSLDEQSIRDHLFSRNQRLSHSTPNLLDLEQATMPHEQTPEVAAYNASILPSKFIMIRHGQSEGNMNESLYATKPDNAMRITDLGWEQAKMAGQALKAKMIASGESVHFIVSPYVRAVETFHGIVSAWCDPSEFNHINDRDERIKAWYGRLLELGLTWHEDPRIREQDFGNYQDTEKIKKCKAERHKFGVFFYRFPHGESASDVFDRVSTFLDSLWRSFDLHKSRNYVLVTHGISIRVFLARYFRYSIDQFGMLANPKNCEMVVLGHDGRGKLRLQGRCEMQLKDKQDNKKQVVGYNFHKRLRVLPKSAIHKVGIRVSPNDDPQEEQYKIN